MTDHLWPNPPAREPMRDMNAEQLELIDAAIKSHLRQFGDASKLDAREFEMRVGMVKALKALKDEYESK